MVAIALLVGNSSGTAQQKTFVETSHAMPWSAMGFSVGLGAALLFAALKIAQAREY